MKKETSKCSYCKKRSTLAAGFIDHEGKHTPIMACDNHWRQAIIDQNKLSTEDMRIQTY